MRLHHVHVTQDFSAPVDRVYAHLAEHENLGPLFGTRVQRVRDGDTERNGVGSCRRLSFNGLLPFEETVTEAVPNERIVYRITKGTPIREHEGVMVFTSTGGGGTHLDYRIKLGSPIPGLTALLSVVLTRSIGKGLRGLAGRL
jgi:uncharacterized protein YndB with AHSA1/START domain